MKALACLLAAIALVGGCSTSTPLPIPCPSCQTDFRCIHMCVDGGAARAVCAWDDKGQLRLADGTAVSQCEGF